MGSLYVNIGLGKPADVILSLDGATAWTTSGDGNLRTFDLASRQLTNSLSVGQKLGALSISPDSKFLIAIEQQLLGRTSTGNPFSDVSTIATYKVDLGTNVVTSFVTTASGYSGSFFDVAVLADGSAMLSEKFLNASGSGDLIWRLDTRTGTYTHLSDPYVSDNAQLYDTRDGSSALLFNGGSTDGALYRFATGVGPVVAKSGLYTDNYIASGGDTAAVAAISSSAGLEAQAFGNYDQTTTSNRVLLRDQALKLTLDLNIRNPELARASVNGLAFDPAGANLFILDGKANQIIQVNTSTGLISRSFSLGFTVNSVRVPFTSSDYGNRLLVAPDGQSFLVVTSDGLRLVQDNGAANNFDGSVGNDTLSGGNGDDVLRGLAGNDLLLGELGNDTLTGGAGDDTINGGDGADLLIGEAGNDVYVMDAQDRIVESVGGGTDTVLAVSSLALSADVEVEILSTISNASTAGLYLTGNLFNQTLIGDYGTNVLTGGGGTDTLIGLRGDDTFVVTTSNTVVVENAGEGIDTVKTNVDYVLSAQSSIEMLSITDASGTAAINLTGSATAQQITGNNGDNIINGFGGGDTMTGLGGNDQYLVRGAGDVVIEGNGGGTDTVFTTVSYNLGVNEVEVLSTVENAATTAIDLIGNFATQTVIGNYGNNVLNGGSGGEDVLIGLRGDDLYAAGSQSIKIVENAGEGNDTLVVFGDYQLRSGVSVEVLSAQNRAGTEAFTLRGNEVAQTVAGNAGNNVIDGRGGSDALIGGAGADVFAFTAALGGGNIDSLVDFLGGTDRIGLASDIFAGVAGGVTAGSFVLGTVAGDGDDRVLYDQASGRLFYDADANGAGASVQFAQLSPGTVLSATDFAVVAPVGDLPA